MLNRVIAAMTKLVHWDAKSVAKWEYTRERGKSRYVWGIGVLGWGGFMFVVMSVFTYIQQNGPVWPTLEDPPVFLVLLNLVVCLSVGYAWGALMWRTMEQSYGMHLGQKQ